MKRSVELDITKGSTREELQEFIDAIPAGTKFDTETYHQEGDRPWESASTTVTLRAEW